MTPSGTLQATLAELKACQAPIDALFQTWLDDGSVDLAASEAAHDAATLAAHRHYYAGIPAYKRLADDLGLADTTDPAEIRAELASTDDIFKSYRQEWIDDGNFAALTTWIAHVSTNRPQLDPATVTSLEGWIAALAEEGIHVRYSSGTSGHLSLVPRDQDSDDSLMTLSLRQLLAQAVQVGLNLPGFDAVLLTFKGGNQGFAALGEKIGGLTASQEFLYPLSVDADLLRAVVTGVSTPEQQEALEEFRRVTVDDLPQHNQRMIAAIEHSVEDDRPVLVFGAPFQLLDLCRTLEADGKRLKIHPDSVVLLGGGWKSFEGARIPREELIGLISERLGFDPSRTIEGYGMTECSVQAGRCAHGRFHFSPAIRPMVVDDALTPIPGGGRGRFAFSDPWATSYPGFFISGDEVELTTEACACGLQGYSIVGEIRRAPGQEVKGCGGVMAQVQA